MYVLGPFSAIIKRDNLNLNQRTNKLHARVPRIGSFTQCVYVRTVSWYRYLHGAMRGPQECAIFIPALLRCTLAASRVPMHAPKRENRNKDSDDTQEARDTSEIRTDIENLPH